MGRHSAFASMWQHPKFDDTVIRLLGPEAHVGVHLRPTAGQADEQVTQECRAEVLLNLRVCKAVLAAASKYWMARIERWDEHADSKMRLKVDDVKSLAVFEETIEPEDLPVIQAAAQYAYTQQLPKGLIELMQAVRLADRWLMSDYMSACLKKVSSMMSGDGLTAQDICGLMADDLPASVQAHPGYQPVKQACAAALVRLFARPQQLCNSKDEQQLTGFWSLPFPALLLWAQQDNLQVDSENSVAMLIAEWWQYNMSEAADVSEQVRQQRREQLSSALRVQHLTASFLLCMLPQLPFFTTKHAPYGFTAVQLLKHMNQWSDAQKSPQKYPAIPSDWLKHPRQPADQEFTFKWEVTKTQLQTLHDSAKSQIQYLYSGSYFWKGYWWGAYIVLKSQNDEMQVGVLGLNNDDGEVPVWTPPHMPSLIPVTWQAHCVNTLGTSKLASSKAVSYNLRAESSYHIAGWGISNIPPPPYTYEAPRNGSLPPNWLMPDGKLRLQIVMQRLDQ